MLKQSYSPYGYKNLLVYKKSEELQKECRRLTSRFPKTKTLIDLADQMDRSARSTKQNIVEGWKRNSTSEYYEFLGFSMAANTELEEDCDDIIKGIYPELMEIKGLMGEMGGMGTPSTLSTPSSLSSPPIPRIPPIPSPSSNFSPSTPSVSSNPLSLSSPFTLSDVEKLPFYPLNSHLPPIVQLKLRCKELNYLLSQLQKSLEQKMAKEKTITAGGKLKMMAAEANKQKKFEDELREKYNLKSPDDY